MSDYRDMKDGAVLVGRALQARGWMLYGFKEDHSDPMTDYFDPETWDGIATKDGRTACVYVNGHDVKSRSGKEETRSIPVPGETCSRCQGSKIDPLGWTLQEARQNPALYKTDELRGRYLDARVRAEVASQKVYLPDGSFVAWLHPAVSPIPFDEQGRHYCLRCQGRGHDMAEPRTEVLFTWPTFQANPRSKSWHVEEGGQIIASGTGLKACSPFSGGGRLSAIEAADALASRIDGASTTGSKTAETAGPVDAATLTENAEKGGLELRFPGKPSEEVRSRMKREAWRWSRFSGCWYNRNTPQNRAFAEELIRSTHNEG